MLWSLKDNSIHIIKHFYLYTKSGKNILSLNLRYITLTTLIIGVVCLMIAMHYIAISLVSE